jgi:hypothetical protein
MPPFPYSRGVHMNRHVFAPAVVLAVTALSAAGIAQTTKPDAKAAAPAEAAPAAPAKFAKLQKGLAVIEVVQVSGRQVGKDIVTVLKIKNMSPGALGLLKAEEFWYDKNLKVVSGDAIQPIRKPIQPGEIVEITFKSPVAPDLYRSRYTFSHANGEIKANQVKAFSK